MTDEGRPAPTAEDIGYECDWGNCPREAVALRWNDSGEGIAAWLPVCLWHRTTESVDYGSLRPAASGGATDGERPLAPIHYEPSTEPREGLFGATREWLERHTRHLNGDAWRDNRSLLDWAAQNLLVDLEPWLVQDRSDPTPVASQADGGRIGEPNLGPVVYATGANATPVASQADGELRERLHQIIELVETSEQHGHPKVRGYQTPAMREVLAMLRRALDGER